MKIMKKWVSLILAGCMTLSLAACGGSASTASADTADAESAEAAESTEPAAELSSDATIEVDIWNNNQLEGLQKIADEWMAETGVKVNINVITWVEYWTLLEAGASGGQMPDVFWMHINEAQKYMRAEKLLNLNDYIAADDAIDLSNYYRRAYIPVHRGYSGLLAFRDTDC